MPSRGFWWSAAVSEGYPRRSRCGRPASMSTSWRRIPPGTCTASGSSSRATRCARSTRWGSPMRRSRRATRSAATGRGWPTARRARRQRLAPGSVEGLPPGNGITRPRLHRILQQHTLDSGADVRTGVTFSDIDDRADGVEVDFTDGEARDYDLVVGADGLYSQVREPVFGPRPTPKLHRPGVLALQPPAHRRSRPDLGVHRPHGTAGFVPLAADLMYMLTIEKPPRRARRCGCEREGIAARYRERLAQFGGIVADHREMIVDDDAVVYRPVENVLVPPPWHRGRVVLIGDAAHAISPHCGQGAAQADRGRARAIRGAGHRPPAGERSPGVHSTGASSAAR